MTLAHQLAVRAGIWKFHRVRATTTDVGFVEVVKRNRDGDGLALFLLTFLVVLQRAPSRR
jgi:hypothetical protein